VGPGLLPRFEWLGTVCGFVVDEPVLAVFRGITAGLLDRVPEQVQATGRGQPGDRLHRLDLGKLELRQKSHFLRRPAEPRDRSGDTAEIRATLCKETSWLAGAEIDHGAVLFARMLCGAQ